MKSTPPTPALRHLLISASAGSGKTYQLVRRYLHLLALGEDAEGVAAMTFTRKAAGEFFNRILRRLAELARSEEAVAAYTQDLKPRLENTPDFQQILWRVTRRMHRLRLGTMDSFFAIMAACFPLELGLPAGARVMDEDESLLARREALDSLLERLYLDAESDALTQLQEAHKQATFGGEEKSVDASLQDWADMGLALWNESQPIEEEEVSESSWGNPQVIWGGRALKLTPLEEAISAVRAAFIPANEAGQTLLEETLQAALETTPGLTPPKRIKELFEKLKDQWEDLLAGHGELMWMRKRMPLELKAARAWVGLVQALMAREFAVRANRTRGLAAVLELFEKEYHARVRARGRLSFADVQRLLFRAARLDSPWLGGTGDLWFRLDGRYQHWLIDEFQDTSRTQWGVLGGLVDEVMQGEEGQKSFFAVGDPKQSIYLWRQAEPDLFEDVLNAYPATTEGRGLHRQPLSKSYRSAQPVLDAVNAVCGQVEVLEELLPTGSLKGFAFELHEASQEQLTGYAALLSPPLAPNKEEQTTALDLTANLLEEIQPLRRGLSCAILVRRNQDAQEMAEALRESTGMNVICESDQHPATDNAVTLALLSLLKLTAHPGDTQALEHLRMTPLWPLIESPEATWRYTISTQQSLVYEQGFAAFVKVWTEKLSTLEVLDGFHALRVAQLADMAAEFDVTGERDMDAFIDFAQSYPRRTRGAKQAVQVMTVHAAKGLEFDVVILPTLDGGAMDELRRENLLTARHADGVQWVLQTPPRLYAQLDPVLRAQLEEARRRAAFEALCRLYVAMTRAKRGLYLVAEPEGKNSKALKESKLLRETLAQVETQEEAIPFLPEEVAVIEWQTGESRWWQEAAILPEKEEAETPPEVTESLGKLLRRVQPSARRRTPSGEEAFTIPGSALFSTGRETGRRLGSLVHELLARVEWWLPGDFEKQWQALEQRWQAARLLTGEAIEERALSQVRQVLESEVCQAAFAMPSPQSLVWREQAFDLVMKGEWVSGIFDRVNLEKDAQGRYQRGWIVDFKTDDVPDAEAIQAKVEGYRPQIALYRQAVQRLTGLQPEQIGAQLLFTRVGKLVAV